MKKLFIHDWDDTITNSFSAYLPYYFNFAKFHDLPIPKVDSIKKNWGKPVSKILKLIYQDTANIPFLIDDFNKNGEHNYQVKIFEDVENVFIRLKNEGYVVGILSSGQKSAIEKVYKQELKSYMKYHEFVYDSNDCNFHKPDPRVFDPIFLENSDFLESQSIYIGDSIFDYLAAKNRGIEFWAVLTGVHTADDFVQQGLSKDKILTKFGDLLSVI